MRAACALFAAILVAGCGGRVDDGGAELHPGGTELHPKPDPLKTLRLRCAPEWKNPVGGAGHAPAPELVAGRWLRCPEEPAGLQQPAYVATFDALELTADRTFFRLSIGPDGFARQTGGLGDTGKWQLLGSDQLLFELPGCDQGKVSQGPITKCGGFDVVHPMFETSPTRMRFYASASFYVKDE